MPATFKSRIVGPDASVVRSSSENMLAVGLTLKERRCRCREDMILRCMASSSQVRVAGCRFQHHESHSPSARLGDLSTRRPSTDVLILVSWWRTLGVPPLLLLGLSCQPLSSRHSWNTTCMTDITIFHMSIWICESLLSVVMVRKDSNQVQIIERLRRKLTVSNECLSSSTACVHTRP